MANRKARTVETSANSVAYEKVYKFLDKKGREQICNQASEAEDLGSI